MTRFEMDAIRAARERLPEDCRGKAATEEQLVAFESRHGPIPAAFRQYLLHFGGGVVGSEWVDDITRLPATVVKFREKAAEWGVPDGFPIGWDGAGNPMLILATGEVVSPDHNFGGVHTLASSLAAFLIGRRSPE